MENLRKTYRKKKIKMNGKGDKEWAIVESPIELYFIFF